MTPVIFKSFFCKHTQFSDDWSSAKYHNQVLLGLSNGYAAKLDFRQKDFSNGLKNIHFQTFQKLLSALIIDNLDFGRNLIKMIENPMA